MATIAQHHQERVLCDKEEELVCVLSGKDPMEIADNLHRRHVICDTMWDLFASLDHSRLEPQLQIRYLLRLVCKKLKEDNSVWAKFLNLLAGMGGNFSTMRRKLKGELNKVTSSVEKCPLTSTASGEADIILTSSDAEQFTNLLAKICYKWEEVGIALDLPKHVREKCRCRDKDVISLANIISSWLSGETNTPTNTTLHTLKKALCGPIVAEPKLAEELGERFQPVKRPRLSLSSEDTSDSHCNVTIINQSGNTVVADGRSTLLLVQASPRESASYQWKKDEHVLEDSSTYTGVGDEILVISHARQGTEGEYTCCVSSEGRKKCSNEIILTVEYSPVKKRLLDLYSITNEVPSDSWSPSGTRTFINLVLIESGKEPAAISVFAFERSSDMAVIAEREKIEYEQVFSECKSGQLILLEGRPGSGKTTLVHKIIKDWTKGRVLVNARWVMLITLRELNNTTAESFCDVLGYFSQNDEAITNNIERDSGDGLCFVIDGLDEYQPPYKRKSPIYQLLNKALLPKAMIIVSSRPSATKDLKWEKLTKRIEIVGFKRGDIFEYIDKFPFCSESDINTDAMYAAKLKEYLHLNPNVLNMCYLPVHVAMICFLFQYKSGSIPVTQTKIYEQFTCCTILRHLKRSNSEEQLESLQDLRGNNKTHFEELCHLAFEMIINSEQVVIPQEVNVQLSDSSEPEESRYLGLVTISHIAKLSGFHSTYTFLHLTFQEFLAAVYIASLNVADQLKIITECENIRMLTVWTFYFGLVKFNKGDERICALFKSNHGGVSRSFLKTVRLEWAFESQQLVVCDEVAQQHGAFDLTHSFSLTHSILSSLSYVMSSTSIPITELGFSLMTDHDVVSGVIKVLHFNKCKLCHLNELELPCVTNCSEMLLVSDVLRACLNLRLAHLHFSHIDADGMKCLADGIKSLSQLQELYLYSDNISGGITHLFSGLQHLQKKKLELYFTNHCVNCDMKAGKKLKQLTVNRVRRLEQTGGNVKAEGAYATGNRLPSLTKLEYLKLCSNNNIGVDEVNYLCVGIKSLSKLFTLDPIGPHGATNLAGVIQYLNFTYLNLSSNNIGSEGATSLAGAIQYLDLKNLNLSSNNFGSEGATSLVCAIQHLDLRNLNLSGNNIGSKGAIILASALQHLKYLECLYLSGNNIDLDSAIVVINALKNCPCGQACFNMKKEDEESIEGFQVRGLLSPGDDASIATLVAAVQHNTLDRKLELGFKEINVPSKHVSKEISSKHVQYKEISSKHVYKKINTPSTQSSQLSCITL